MEHGLTVSSVLYWVAIAATGMLGVGVVALGAYAMGFVVQWMRNRYLSEGRGVAAQRTQIATELGRLHQIEDLAKKDALVAARKLAELNSSLRRLQIEQESEAATLKKDLAMKNRGVLSQIAQQMGEQIAHQRAMEDRFQHERQELEHRVAALREANDGLRQQVEQLARKQDHGEMSQQRLLAEKDALATQTAAEKEALLNQIADLRSYLAAAEAKQPINQALMNIVKEMDHLSRAVAMISHRVGLDGHSPAVDAGQVAAPDQAGGALAESMAQRL